MFFTDYLKKLNKETAAKLVRVAAVIIPILFLSGCINQSTAEKLMKKNLNDRVGKGNYTISNVYKSAPNEYSLSHNSVHATVTLNTGEEFHCIVYNIGGYTYQDEYSSLYLRDELKRVIEDSTQNLDGVEINRIYLPDDGLIYTSGYYDKTQLYDFMNEVKNGLNVSATYIISDSLSPEEALDVAKGIVNYYESISFPYLNIFFRYGSFEHLYEYGETEPRTDGTEYDTRVFDEDYILERFEEEKSKDVVITDILNERYGENNWTLSWFESEVSEVYRVEVEYEGETIVGSYGDGVYKDNYAEVFMYDELMDMLHEPQYVYDGVYYFDKGDLKCNMTEESYAGRPEDFLKNTDAYEYNPLIKIDSTKYTIEEAAKLVCEIDDYYRTNGYKADTDYEYDKYRFYISFVPLNGDEAMDKKYLGAGANYTQIVDYLNMRYAEDSN